MYELWIKNMKNKGLTFLEIVIGIALISITMAGLFQMLQMALNSSYRATQEMIATNLARGLMAEIMSKEFEDPELAAGSFGTEESGRQGGIGDTFDDVDDYDDFSESPPKYMNGTTMDGTGGTPNYSGFGRNVIVRNVDSGLVNGAADGTTDYKEVSVTASGPYVRDISIIEIKVNIE